MAPWFPLKLRLVLANIAPFQAMKKLMHIVKIMDVSARQVIQTKRDAILKGEDAIKQQIAEGKDIMSILRMSASSQSTSRSTDSVPQCMPISKNKNLIDCQTLSSSD